MQGETKERWQRLCEQASSEQDPDRLMVLIREIDKLLADKEQRLQQQRAAGRAPHSSSEQQPSILAALSI